MHALAVTSKRSYWKPTKTPISLNKKKNDIMTMERSSSVKKPCQSELFRPESFSCPYRSASDEARRWFIRNLASTRHESGPCCNGILLLWRTVLMSRTRFISNTVGRSPFRRFNSATLLSSTMSVKSPATTYTPYGSQFFRCRPE